MARPSDEQLKKAITRGRVAGQGLRQTFTGRKAKTLKARDLKKGNKFKPPKDTGRKKRKLKITFNSPKTTKVTYG